jgi:hypothetical protein
MQWADVTAAPSAKKLRQFAALWLVFFVGLALVRLWHGRQDVETATLAAFGVTIGMLGLIWPAAIRVVYTGWMIAAFPIGWTVSRVMLAALFYGVFTPVAVVFRMIGRDPLALRRRGDLETYWTAKPGIADPRDYFRQS